MVEIKFKRLRGTDIKLPQKQTPQAAGMDIRADIDDYLTIFPGQIVLIPTGFAMSMPEGYEAQIRPRSGLAINYGITIVNSPGTIDSDYRGEVKVDLINLSNDRYEISRGDRIAQMIINKVEHVAVEEVDELDDTERGDGGFGSTGR